MVATKPFKGLVDDWRRYLAEEAQLGGVKELEMHERTGRPLGSDQFIEMAEKILGRELKKKKPGPKIKKES